MQVDESTWQAIVEETKRKLAEWKEEGHEFVALTQANEKSQLLITEHRQQSYAGTGYYVTDRHAVGRELANGQLCKVTISKKGKNLVAKFKAGPKAWESLAGKSVEQIVKGLKLTNFLVVRVGAIIPNKREDGKTLCHVSGFLRSDHGKNYGMIVEEPDDFSSPHDIAERDAGAAYGGCSCWPKP
jgi:hypothetical protein